MGGWYSVPGFWTEIGREKTKQAFDWPLERQAQSDVIKSPLPSPAGMYLDHVEGITG